MAHNHAGLAEELATFAHDVLHMYPEGNLLLLRSTCRSLLSFVVHKNVS
jgi:hypothetical protein